MKRIQKTTIMSTKSVMLPIFIISNFIKIPKIGIPIIGYAANCILFDICSLFLKNIDHTNPEIITIKGRSRSKDQCKNIVTAIGKIYPSTIG